MKRSRFVIDLTKVTDLASLHATLRAVLPLPKTYGDNLDAWYDVLTEYGSTWTIDFRGTPPDGFREVCADAVAATPGLIIRFVLRPRRAKR